MTKVDKETVDRAIALIKKGSANSDYFFEQLQSPIWIEPLAQANLFSMPPSAIRRGESISFPAWIPGQYLARMAAIPAAQQSVLEILKQVPPNADNPRVYEVVADAASTLPGKMARQLTPLLERGTELRFQLNLPDKVASVIMHLAHEGFATEALSLARTLLAIAPQPPIEKQEEDSDDLKYVNREPRGRISDWEYGEIVEKVLGRLVKSADIQAFDLFSDLLEAAVAAGRKEVSEGPEDYSYIWRTSIQHADARRDNLRDELVSSVVEAAGQIIASTPNTLSLLVDRLWARPTRIFHRIALFLLWRHGEQNIEAVRKALEPPTKWDDIGTHPEYELLLSRFFNQLDLSTQQQFLDWIDEGPDLERYIAFRKEMMGQEPAASDVKLHQDIWTRDHLAVIGENLKPAYKERLVALEASIGPAREVGRSLYRVSVGMHGERSPLSEEETLSLDWTSLITKLQEWRPAASTFDAPSIEGLANSLRQRVTADPSEAVRHLREIANVRPVYLSTVLEALRDAIKKKEPLQWDLLLAFLSRVIDEADRAVDEPDRWRWVSKAAASLIGDSFEAGPTGIPIQFREEVWTLIRRLAENPDPTPEHEQQFGGSNMDPATLSLNTVRGEIFHAVVRYSLWLRRSIEKQPDGAVRVSRGFEELPEVRALLDSHLDVTTESSLAVRAVYGQWFPWLVLIDSGWAISRRDRIFPREEKLISFFWAAWGAYIVFDRPYTTVLPILRPIYARAIKSIDEGMSLQVGLGERPSQHLAEHLMAYYWRGEVTLAKDDLVQAFFASADAKLRGRALEWLGRTLNQLEDALTPVTEEKLRALWEWRSSVSPAAPEELEAFGWWFASGRLEQRWSLQNLRTVLAHRVLPEPDHMVAERLAAISKDYCTEALEDLTWMIDLAADRWSIHGWLDSARQILATGLNSREIEVRSRAERIINKLGALRFRDFRELLKSVEQEKPANSQIDPGV